MPTITHRLIHAVEFVPDLRKQSRGRHLGGDVSSGPLCCQDRCRKLGPSRQKRLLPTAMAVALLMRNSPKVKHCAFSCSLSTVTRLHLCPDLLRPANLPARPIASQHAFAIKVARIRSVAQSRSVLQLAIQIQIPLPLATPLTVSRLSISTTSSQRQDQRQPESELHPEPEQR